MSEVTIVRPPEEKFSWTTEILKVELHKEMKAPVEHAQKIRQRISREVKLQEPNWVFETDTQTEPDFIIVKRVA